MIRRFSIIGLLAVSSSAMATELNMLGASGALTTPGAEVIKEGHFEVQANTDQRAARDQRLTRRGNDQAEARTYLIGVGLLPRVELVGRVAAPNITGPTPADLSANLKISLYQSQFFGLAAGILDVAGDAQKATSRYAVGSASYKAFHASLGYGDGQLLDGVFGNLSYTPKPFVSLIADYDAKAFNAGARLRHEFGNGLKVALTGKLYTDSYEKASYALSISRSLDFHGGNSLLPQRYLENVDSLFRSNLFSADRDGLRNISLRDDAEAGTVIVRAENAAYLQRQSDSDQAACAQLAPETNKKAVYAQYRYGLPILSTRINCGQKDIYERADIYDRTGLNTWLTQWQDQEQIKADFTRAGAYGLEVRFTPDLRSFAATDVGIFDYSLALFSTARLQLPAGFGAYTTYESPIDSTDDFNNPQFFQFYKHDRGIREAQVQWAHHLVPGLFGLHSIGKSKVFSIDYRSQRNDLVFNLLGGTHQVYGSYARYKPINRPALPTRKIELVGYRLFLPKLASSFEADIGKFFYGDDGFRLRANRYFGDTMVTLYMRRSDSENQVAGLELSIPLTLRRGLSAGPLTVVGDPRFRFARATSFGQSNGQNSLKPLLLIEPEPEYTLRTDWLDSDRLFPDNSASMR